MTGIRHSTQELAKDTSDQPLRPLLAVASAELLARDRFDFAGAATELPSERGRNFRIDAPGGERRVLKVTWDDPSRAFVELETRTLGRAASAGLPVARVWQSRAGSLIEDVSDELGRRCGARLLDYLEGGHLADVPKALPVLGSLGSVLGRLDALLVGESYPAAERVFHWDLARAPEEITARLDAIRDPARRSLVERLVECATRETAPRLAMLRRGVIHNDANDYNVLVAAADRSDLEPTYARPT